LHKEDKVIFDNERAHKNFKGRIKKWIAHVGDHFSKWHILWPQEHKSADEVVCGLKTHVYCLPQILQSECFFSLISPSAMGGAVDHRPVVCLNPELGFCQAQLSATCIRCPFFALMSDEWLERLEWMNWFQMAFHQIQ
jgi:hypothetical protein